ncbi:response regulator transcription factor [Frondihabitans australicus]|uniref:Two-component system OmpR family response regulator n=1 Tax=Frondihabitans australicus TaxID=386892 RepID=A0A495II45_9MICO|nr:response regulator transcription factor [Frondihabitans australicus]RKR75370.1 two-component system OmpR family response regulator [Frondihabitans australicus]
MSRILVVDDDPEMRELVAASLADEGHDVTAVGDGVAALIEAGRRTFDAAAVDVMLPEMTGFEICRRLRESGRTFPVILVTARDAVDDRIFGLDSGADDYLTKPFSLAELNARIRAQLRRQATVPTAPAMVEAGDVQLDTTAVRARIGGRTVAFSVKEFSLLRFLLVEAPEPVTRAAILTEVWGSAEHFDPTIVDQYVSYVRRKLAGAASTVTIATVRGVGYRAEAPE